MRRFQVNFAPDENGLVGCTFLNAHLVFNNESRGEGLVFRRYYDDSVRTEKVGEFQIGSWTSYYEVDQ